MKYQGLSEEQVIKNREEFGTNIISPPDKVPLWKLFLEKFNDPIIRILLIAALLSLVISFVHMEFIETIGIFSAIILATGIAFWFDLDASRKFDILNKVNDDVKYKLVREGHIIEIAKKDIVKGDVVILETGEELPADGLLLEAVSLQIDESSLTGESLITKTTDPSKFKNDATYPSNMVMKGSTIMDGHCIIEVVAVGDNTDYGKLAKSAAEISGEQTPLNLQLDKLARFIGIVGFSVAIFTFVILFSKDFIFGDIQYGFNQMYLIISVLLSVMILLAKIWLPVIYDVFELLGKKGRFIKDLSTKKGLFWLGFAILFLAISFAIGYLIGINAFENEAWLSLKAAGKILQFFMIAVTIIVVAVPEGLPMSVTLSLAMSMRRMLKSNNLVRRMHACETMGSATVICTDKTGTLTMNQMRVNDTSFCDLVHQNLDNNEAGSLVKENISVNSTAYLDINDKSEILLLGNPTEAALLLWLHQKNIDYLQIRESSEIVGQLTFSTERKYMATIVDSTIVGKRVLYVKGAPEIILDKCSKIRCGDEYKPVDDLKSKIEDLLLQYNSKAMRTLAFAYEIIEDNLSRFENGKLKNSNLIFLGVAAISDPVREDVPDAVKRCIEAGIEVKIVTGDTKATAKEIGRQIGIWNDDTNNKIITGEDFAEMSDSKITEMLGVLKILCRARPSDKQRLVQLLQKNGEIVAVTGDGTNDAPALNFAHVGLSMGSGTAVAKEASDITLIDDSFSSITSAVLWGRSLYQNIQRFILFQLTINLTALLVVLIGSLFGFELPLTVTQMLWVNLIMDTFAAGALASLPPNQIVMKSKPRNNKDFIINPAMRINILFTGLSFVIIMLSLLFLFSKNGDVNRYELSVFFTVFVMLQFWNLFNSKAFASGKSAFSNLIQSKGFLIVLFVIFIGQVLIVEFGGDVFRTVPIKLKDWVIIVLSTSVVLWVGY